jgi:hypothetical protein
MKGDRAANLELAMKAFAAAHFAFTREADAAGRVNTQIGLRIVVTEKSSLGKKVCANIQHSNSVASTSSNNEAGFSAIFGEFPEVTNKGVPFRDTDALKVEMQRITSQYAKAYFLNERTIFGLFIGSPAIPSRVA